MDLACPQRPINDSNKLVEAFISIFFLVPPKIARGVGHAAPPAPLTTPILYKFFVVQKRNGLGMRIVFISVADPDPDPVGSGLFGSPGSGSGKKIYGSGSGSGS